MPLANQSVNSKYPGELTFADGLDRFDGMSDVKRFGAVGDGETDDGEAIRHAVEEGDGVLRFPPGEYRVTEPVEIPLSEHGPCGLEGSGGTARIIMAGPGPAFRLVGEHGGTGDPGSRKGNVETTQRLPTARNLEVAGDHPEADGFELVRTMQAVFEGVLVTRCRHGIHLVERNRNIILSNCHLYFNTGAGLYLDGVNLHQINVAGCHLSYNRLGGIRIERSEIRNLQITGNDIEYNNHRSHKSEPEPTAEIFIDASAPEASVNEVIIASNTIQATNSPGGCNLLVKETPDNSRPPGLFAVTGNVIGSQENNVRLVGCYGVTLSGNTIYSCSHRNLLVQDSRLINVTGNIFRRHVSRYGTGARFERSSEVTFASCSILDETEEGEEGLEALLELEACERVNVSGSQFTNGAPASIAARDCSHVTVTSCSLHDVREKPKAVNAVKFTGKGGGHLVAMNSIGPTSGPPISGEYARTEGNVIPEES